MSNTENLTTFLQTGRSDERVLLDHFDEASLTVHWNQHDEHDGGVRQPETCDHCFVQPMLVELHAAYFGSGPACEILADMSNGYGDGECYDWSGVRDSDPATIREMWKAIHA